MSQYTSFIVKVTVSVREMIEAPTLIGSPTEYMPGKEDRIATLEVEGPRPFVKDVISNIGMALDEIETV